MSDSHPIHSDTGRKVIGIKPVTVREKDEYHKSEIELDQTVLKLKQAQEDLEKARNEAGFLTKEAERQIAIERSEWESEKKRLYEEVKQSAYETGFETGRSDAQKQYEEFVDKARELADLAQQDYQTILDKSEDAILTLSIKAASKIIHKELETTDAFLEIVKNVLKEAKQQENIAVYIHPDDYQLVISQQDELRNIVVGEAHLQFYPDIELTRGSCIVETSFGRIDASVDTRLIELREKLFEALRENSDED
ncbi:flagellar assembly protein FliH [Sediminibacillus dalangtanensis]|uniref:Flagellar assembly protein FliH n=1 Tax=Sediminibacillus dalangtanensis TaxID=2729421 RepID=A0ABX7VR63_9BACI|nr:flagellar assembly protein FliH [Sediminibacillus dalangtanensis]QTM99412.1 flagellar assembly protein FliH [Sediminibacillus dalangtanensis]